MRKTIKTTGGNLHSSPLVHVDDVAQAYLTAKELLLVGIVQGRLLPVNLGGGAYRNREVMQTWEGAVFPERTAQINIAQAIRTMFAELN